MNDDAVWQSIAEEVRRANASLAAPPGLAERALLKAAQGGPGGGLRRSWRLMLAQVPLVRREMFPASAMLMLLGVAMAVMARRVGVFNFLAPMIAAASLATIYSRDQDPAAELTLATPTSAWKLLLARMTLVSGYNLGLALAASVALFALMPAGLLGSLILGWLAPLTFLSALALVLSMWLGTGTALLIAYTAWMLQWIPALAPLAGYRAFWNNEAALGTLAVAMVGAALWSAERAARPGEAVAG